MHFQCKFSSSPLILPCKSQLKHEIKFKLSPNSFKSLPYSINYKQILWFSINHHNFNYDLKKRIMILTHTSNDFIQKKLKSTCNRRIYNIDSILHRFKSKITMKYVDFNPILVAKCIKNKENNSDYIILQYMALNLLN